MWGVTILWVFSSVIFLSLSKRVRRAAAAAEKWPRVEKALIEVLAVQPQAWTLIETESGDLSMSVPQLSRILNPPLVLMITPSKVQVCNTTLQMNNTKPANSNEHIVRTCRSPLTARWLQHLEDTVWLIRATILRLELNTQGIVPSLPLCIDATVCLRTSQWGCGGLWHDEW